MRFPFGPWLEDILNLEIIKPEGIDLPTWEILLAAKSGSVHKILELLRSDPHLVNAEYWYTQPIHFAVREGHLSALEILLKNGADSTWIRYGHEELPIVARDRGHRALADCIIADRASHNVNKNFPIHEAIMEGNYDHVEKILNSSPEQISVGNSEGLTPLHLAVEKRDFRLVNLLCQEGSLVDAIQKGGSKDWYRPRGQRPIDIALNHGDTTMIKFLLAREAAYTLDLAVVLEDKEKVRDLLADSKIFKNMDGRPLGLAAQSGNEEMVRLLLEMGVSPNLSEGRNAPKGSALWTAVSKGYYRIVEMILKAGADPNQGIESSGTSIHQAKNDQMKSLLYQFGAKSKTAADFILDGNIDGLASLIDKDPENISNAGCGSIFTYVVMKNKPNILELLISRGIRVPPVVTGCRTYLWRYPDLTRRLLEYGMDPNLPNWQWVTPMHNFSEVNPMFQKNTNHAKSARKKEIKMRKGLVDLFLEFGADLNKVDEEYRSTPLGWAARQRQKDMVKILLERGADPNGGEPWAKPLAWAERREYPEIQKMLKKAGAKT